MVFGVLSGEPFKLIDQIPPPPHTLAVVYEDSAILLTLTSAKSLSDLCALLVYHPNCGLRACRGRPDGHLELFQAQIRQLGFIPQLTGEKCIQQFYVCSGCTH